MDSTMYRFPFPLQKDEVHIRWEWFRPETDDGLDADMKQHLEMGGLELRAIPCSRGDEDEHEHGRDKA